MRVQLTLGHILVFIFIYVILNFILCQLIVNFPMSRNSFNTCRTFIQAVILENLCFPLKATPKKKKKRRKSLESSVGDGPDLICLGTTSGSILLYSILKGDLQTLLVSCTLYPLKS